MRRESSVISAALNYITDTNLSSLLDTMVEIVSYTALRHLSQLFFAVIFFHVSEFILAAAIHGRSNVSLTSLLISKSYLLAMMFSVLEYILEIYYFPELKEYWWISNFGLVMVLVGEVIRKVAIVTAGRSFTHLIKVRHEEHHKLVTEGVYGYFRHPGYTGFFVWSVGTQVMLCNPLSSVAFTVVVWNFFAKRIPYEEFFLRKFFWVGVRGIFTASVFWDTSSEVVMNLVVLVFSGFLDIGLVWEILIIR